MGKNRNPLTSLVLLLAVAACGGGGGSHAGRPDTPAPTAVPIPTSTPAVTPALTLPPLPSVGSGTIARGVDAERPVSIGSGGEGYLVAFGVESDDGVASIAGVRISWEGEIRDAIPVPLVRPGPSEGGWSFESPAVAYDGGSHSVVYLAKSPEGSEPARQVIAAVEVPASGEPDSARILAEQSTLGTDHCPTAFAGPIAATGHDASITAVWSSVPFSAECSPFDPTIAFALQGARVSARGQGVEAFELRFPQSGIVTVASSPPGLALAPNFAVTATGFIAVSGAQPRARHLLSGTVSGLEGLPSHGEQWFDLTALPPIEVAVAAAVDQFLVAWTEEVFPGDSGQIDLHVNLYRADMNPSGPFSEAVIQSGADVRLGGVAFTRGRYLVTWTDGTRVWGTRITAPGESEPPFVIHEGPAGVPAVAIDSHRFLVVHTAEVDGSSAVVGSFVSAE